MTDPGRSRRFNEDALYAGRCLFVVADGWGSLGLGGEVASATVIETLKSLDAPVSVADAAAGLERRMKDANEALRRLCDEYASAAGTTVAAMLRTGKNLVLAHIGGCRAYLLRDRILYQITADHTVAQLKIDAGLMTEDQATASTDRHLLVRWLGARSEHRPDLSIRRAQIDDRYLLCTDGLLVVDARGIHHVLDTVDNPQTAAEQLVDRANAAGGPDNIACVIVDIKRADPQ